MDQTKKFMHTPLVWELVKIVDDHEIVLRASYVSAEEFCRLACMPGPTHPRSILPESMLSDADAGEWIGTGLRFVHEGQEYLLRCRVTAREENEKIVHDPIPEPLSLGVGVSIDMVSDHMDSPTWYVGVYDGTGDWLGEVPTRMDPMRTSLAEIDELAVSVARYILHEYPQCVVGVDEIARRIRMVLRTARVGAPRSYPEIEREEGA